MDIDISDFDSLLERAEVKDWLFRAARDMFPKMKDSACSVVIGTDQCDAKLALEIGAAVMFNKPIIVALPKGRTIPDGLRRIAAEVVEIDDFNSASPGPSVINLQAALERVLGRRKEGA